MFRQVICSSGRLGSKASRQNLSFILKRNNSTPVAATQVELEEWSSARPFEEIPGPKPLPLIGNIWRFLPYIGTLSTDFSVQFYKLYNEFGTIVKLEGIPGRNNMVSLYNPDDIEKVFRNEGPWPRREGIRSALYYRQVLRKDFFEGVGGALITQGEEWHTFRTKVNQIMLQPKTTKLYVQPIDAVATDFIERIRKIRNNDLEMPEDFSNELCKWALESVMYISLDTRLGCLAEDLPPDSEPQKMIDTVQVLFDSMYNLDFKLSPWRIISTPQWRKFVKASDYFTNVCVKYIEQALTRLKTLPPDSDRELTIVEKILARDSNPKTAIVMAIDMMSAGVDTVKYCLILIHKIMHANTHCTLHKLEPTL
ncbi:hypothetical protein C0J52_18994 [Blattella germanica]|nr:hypothetical protein C0J52_18994 [Blattella germanica]